jgi:RNA polymerase sigma-70 factor (ECF subfamily)
MLRDAGGNGLGGRDAAVRRAHGREVAPARIVAAIAATRAGDQSALHDLYVAYAPAVHATVCAVLHDEYEAEDVTQQLFARLGKALERYEPTQVPFSAWIVRVARNAAIDQLRSRRRLPVAELSVQEAVTADDDGGMHHGMALRTALGELPEDQRRVVVMRHVLGLSPGEIADRLGKSETAVHGLHHRGRRRMRAGLIRLGSVPQTQVTA